MKAYCRRSCIECTTGVHCQSLHRRRCYHRQAAGCLYAKERSTKSTKVPRTGSSLGGRKRRSTSKLYERPIDGPTVALRAKSDTAPPSWDRGGLVAARDDVSGREDTRGRPSRGGLTRARERAMVVAMEVRSAESPQPRVGCRDRRAPPRMASRSARLARRPPVRMRGDHQSSQHGLHHTRHDAIRSTVLALFNHGVCAVHCACGCIGVHPRNSVRSQATGIVGRIRNGAIRHANEGVDDAAHDEFSRLALRLARVAWRRLGKMLGFGIGIRRRDDCLVLKRLFSRSLRSHCSNTESCSLTPSTTRARRRSGEEAADGSLGFVARCRR